MKIAGVQMNVVLGDPQQNMDRMIQFLRQTKGNGAHLTVFPECCLTGYCFGSLDEALPFAQPLPGPAIATMQKACAELGCWAIFGMLEADGERVFNAAVLVGPNGLGGVYRKVHLPFLGIDMFTTHGDMPFAVHEAGDLRVGMNICYDSAFPEAARSLTLLGADLIALPTNWPGGAECTASCCVNARALENGVYYIAVNRGRFRTGLPVHRPKHHRGSVRPHPGGRATGRRGSHLCRHRSYPRPPQALRPRSGQARNRPPRRSPARDVFIAHAAAQSEKTGAMTASVDENFTLSRCGRKGIQ